MAQPRLNVLIVEHDTADAELSIIELQRAGFDIDADVVATPDEFARHLHALVYDVVLADYRLPEWTGMDALVQMRALGVDTPLILVTGTLGDERAVECVRLGAADYLLKENIARLPLAVRRAMADADARRRVTQADARTREAEAAVREREARFTQLAESISEVFFLVDAQFRETLYVNRAYEDIWGRTTASLYHDPQSFLEGVLPDDRARLTDSIAAVQRGETPGPVDFRVVRPGGEVRWVFSHAVPVRDANGEVYRISGIILDITEQHATRAALEESEARFRKLADASFDAIVVSQEGILREVNRGFITMFGYESEDEIIGRAAADFCTDESAEMIGWGNAAEPKGTYDVVGHRKDGSLLLLEVTERAHTVGGRPGRIAALRNVTEHRMLEEQFRQAQKMEAVGRLAGGVAHDFNNQLTVISSYADLMLDGFAPDDPRRQELDHIQRSVSAAAGLTRQLLAFSRQQVIQPQLVNLGDIIASTEAMLQRVIGEDIQLVTVIGAHALAVRVDPTQIEHVLMNLAVNARDAMPTGGKLAIDVRFAELDDEYARTHWPAVAGRFAMFAIRDSGTGMTDATRARLFEPFFTTKELGKGTGLGLATVYGVVKQSGGFICVDTALGVGTTFSVYLPLVEDELVDGVVRATRRELPQGTETVLVAEDAAAVRAVTCHVLSKLGYHVVEAPDGAEALRLAGATDIDLLLTDVVMPEMSGRELAERFLRVRPAAKVLYTSGYTDDAVLRHGVLSSSVAFLQKPFTPESLAKKVRDVLDR